MLKGLKAPFRFSRVDLIEREHFSSGKDIQKSVEKGA